MQHRDSRDTTTFRRLGILLIVLGGLGALATLGGMTFLYDLWPLLITMLGIGLIGIDMKRRRRGLFFLGGGVYLTGFSALALYCNFTSWTQMAMMWPLFIGLLGLCLVAIFALHKAGRVMLVSGLLLVAVAIGFSIILAAGGHFWWTMLVLVGLSILIPEAIPCRRNP